MEHGHVDATDNAYKAELVEVAHLQYKLVDEVVNLGKTLCAAMDAHPGFVPCDHAFFEFVEGLCLSIGAFTNEDIEGEIERVNARRLHIEDHRGVSIDAAKGVVETLSKLDVNSPMRVKLALLLALEGLAPYVMRSFELGVTKSEHLVLMARAANLLGTEDADFKECLSLEKELGGALQELLFLGL